MLSLHTSAINGEKTASFQQTQALHTSCQSCHRQHDPTKCPAADGNCHNCCHKGHWTETPKCSEKNILCPTCNKTGHFNVAGHSRKTRDWTAMVELPFFRKEQVATVDMWVLLPSLPQHTCTWRCSDTCVFLCPLPSVGHNFAWLP